MSDKLARKRRRLERRERRARAAFRHRWLFSLVYVFTAAVAFAARYGGVGIVALVWAVIIPTAWYRELVEERFAKRHARLERLEAVQG